MSETHHIPILFYIAALFSLGYFIYNSRRLFAVAIGKPETKLPDNLLTQFIDTLTFGIGQRRVMSRRFTYPAVMHFLLGWGFMELLFATTVDFFLARGWFVSFLPGKDTPWFAFLNDTAGLMLFAGLLMALYRRLTHTPDILPNNHFKGRGNLFGDTGIILFLMLLVIGGFLSEAARLAADSPQNMGYSWIGYTLSGIFSQDTWVSVQPFLWWFHALTSLAFIAVLPATKIFHAIAVVLNIAVTNRKRRGDIRPMNVSALMEDPEADLENISLGVNDSKDFTWKQLLDSVACTECSRCTSVCPAALTGKPLSPMKIITDIRKHLYHQTLGTGKETSLVGGLVTEAELWSCTTCAACMDVCPVLIDHIPTFTDMRRYLVLSEGKPPENAGDSLEKTMQTGNPWGLPRNNRIKWFREAGLELPLFSEKKSATVLYWVGCAGSYDPRNQEVSKSMVKIFREAGVDFAVLGNEESCTGDSARRLGEEYIFETMALNNIETLNKYEFDTIVTQCPHCFHTLNNEYPHFGGDYKVMHHSEFIEKLISEGKLNLPDSSDDLPGRVTYHDACYLGRHNDIYDAPRNLIQATTGKNRIEEMPQNRNASFCCGAGGGNMWHEINDGERINVKRFEEAVSTGAQTIATACSFCMIMMDDAMRVKGMEEQVQIKDIAELISNRI